MDANYCGLNFCVSYYQDRGPFYTDFPYHLCSYHGLETDLLNLTACWGYEVWRFSTSCAIVIETVKVSGVILFLGLGSYLFYKLYDHARGKKKTSLLRWASDELLDGSTDIDNGDLQNIETKYFGPDEITNEDADSDLGGDTSTSENSWTLTGTRELNNSKGSLDKNGRPGH